MGNVVDFSRPSFGGPPVIPRDNSFTGITWDDFIRTRVPQNHIPSDNGYNLCEYILPEPVLERILCKLPPEEILKCNTVILRNILLHLQSNVKEQGLVFENDVSVCIQCLGMSSLEGSPNAKVILEKVLRI